MRNHFIIFSFVLFRRQKHICRHVIEWQHFFRYLTNFPSWSDNFHIDWPRCNELQPEWRRRRLRCKIELRIYDWVLLSHSAHNLRNDKRFIVFVHFVWVCPPLMLLLLLPFERRNFIENNKIGEETPWLSIQSHWLVFPVCYELFAGSMLGRAKSHNIYSV